eukprot:1643844-Alexandrium_andersonii.AAC.1
MSASLVGSEMCIRDSPCSRGSRSGGPPRRLLAVQRPHAARAARWLSAACLLYTSDAADDM